MRSLIHDWTDIVRRLRLGAAAKSVALAMATYADPDGTRVFPGIARLAYVTELHHVTVKRALKRLRDTGLIIKVGKKGDSDEYRLSLVDVLNELHLPSPAEVEIEVDKIKSELRGTYRKKLPVPEAPAEIDDEDDLRVPETTAEAHPDGLSAGAQGTHGEESAGALGYGLRVPWAPATYTDPPHKNTLHSGEDQIADVTVESEPVPETNQNPSISPFAEISATALRLGDERCEPHRLPKATCHFCRRGLPGDGALPRNGRRIVIPVNNPRRIPPEPGT